MAVGRILVLGGIRSGKSRYAGSLLRAESAVRYLATAPLRRAAADRAGDAGVTTGRAIPLAGWETVECGVDLAKHLRGDTPMLVDDLGTWLTGVLDGADDGQRAADAVAEPIAAVAGAVAASTAPVVLVSPEVGLTVAPRTAADRAFADALGTLNREIAAVCDAVVLVVAGSPLWIKGGPAAGTVTRLPPVVRTAPAAGGHPTGTVLPVTQAASGPAEVGRGEAVPGGHGSAEKAEAAAVPTEVVPTDTVPADALPSEVPLPDEEARAAADERLAGLGPALGRLRAHVAAAAAYQGTASPTPYTDVRLMLLGGDHAGGAAAGAPPAWEVLRTATAGGGPYPHLAEQAGARVEIVELPAADVDMTDADVLTADAVAAALATGLALADRAVDSGADLLVLGSAGAGGAAAGAAVIALGTGAEPAALLARVVTADGSVDDNAWMARCATVRDALRRVRSRERDPRSLLAEVGGTDVAVATGIVLGAALRRTPVVVDGPVGAAAALLARDTAPQSRHWLAVFDDGRHPAVRLVADVLGVAPVVDLGLGLGEGANALAVLPLVQTALALSGALAADWTGLAADPAPAG